MKRKLTYNEIIEKITDAYFEVLINDEKEVEEILKEAKINFAEFDNGTDSLISKLNRDIQIKANNEKNKNKNHKKLYNH